MRYRQKSAPQPISPEVIATQIEQIASLPPKDLKVAWTTEFRREPPIGLWRDLLVRTLAWRLQEKAFGGYDRATLKLLRAHVSKGQGDWRCKRLKVGTVLIREYGGIRHTVIKVPEGFVWQEKTYSSLTTISRLITGVNWSGPRFFGLREGKAGKETEKAA